MYFKAIVAKVYGSRTQSDMENNEDFIKVMFLNFFLFQLLILDPVK